MGGTPPPSDPFGGTLPPGGVPPPPPTPPSGGDPSGSGGGGAPGGGGGDDPAQEGIGSFFEGAVLGDFTEENQTWSKVAGQVVIGFVPGVGQVADYRDSVAALDQVWDGKDGAWGNLALAGIGWIPIGGDIAKSLLRIGRKELKVLRGGEQVLKHANDVKRAEQGGAGFVARLRGELVKLPGVSTQTIQYVKRTEEELAKLRRAFNNSEREKFLKHVASDPDKVAQLKAAGLSDIDIRMMRDGGVPDGFQVHHKLPLDDSGTNDIGNLVLIKNEPYHKALTNAQGELTRGMKPGETRTVDFPIPPGFVYPPGG